MSPVVLGKSFLICVSVSSVSLHFFCWVLPIKYLHLRKLRLIFSAQLPIPILVTQPYEKQASASPKNTEEICLSLKCTADPSCLPKCFYPLLKLTAVWNNWFFPVSLFSSLLILQYLPALDYALWWWCICFKTNTAWNCKRSRNEWLKDSMTSQWMGWETGTVSEEHPQGQTLIYSTHNVSIVLKVLSTRQR